MTNSGDRQGPSGRRRPLTPLRRAIVGIAACALAAGVAACSSTGPGVSSAAGSGGSGGSGASAASGSGSEKMIRIGLTNAAITAYSANYAVGQYLGCYKKLGYQIHVQGYPGPSALLAAFQQGSVDIGVPGSDQYVSFVNTIKKSGNSLPLMAFYELAYPFRYGMAVKAGSGITSLQQLAGKSVGIATQSDSSNATLQAVLKQNGMSPTSIKTIATGTGAGSAQALSSGKVSALWFNDVGVGAVLGDNVPLSFVTISGKKPFVNAGGILAFTTQKEYTSDKAMFQAFATCATEGDIFSKANPAAASYILLQQYPQLGLVGQPLDKQIAKLDLGITLRAPLFHSTDATAQYGAMNETEYTNDQSILLGMSAPYLDMTPYWTNDLIGPANAAVDTAAITKQAQDFKIPGISGDVAIPDIPANSP
ncbi:MAG TPA: ABC transporter substrate-binding protein [Trebonia sp.]|jgi:ABC-type nitrate/sulfonate/bicarbonate transport system substrate-binding protein|nr:ABC transporter substrate-binding protein [Trebonia sp.]